MIFEEEKCYPPYLDYALCPSKVYDIASVELRSLFSPGNTFYKPITDKESFTCKEVKVISVSDMDDNRLEVIFDDDCGVRVSNSILNKNFFNNNLHDKVFIKEKDAIFYLIDQLSIKIKEEEDKLNKYNEIKKYLEESDQIKN